MTFKEFVAEMSVLEACKKSSREQRGNRNSRWKGVYRVVQDYSADVWKEACTRLLADGDGYLPSSDEILAACDEVQDERNLPKPLKSQYEVAPHVCAVDRNFRNYTAQLIGTLMGYEGQHLYCPGDILATCPLCGRRWEAAGLFKGFFDLQGESMEGINDRVKGYLICDQCTKEGKKW